MPAYNTQNPPFSQAPGDQPIFLWQAEVVPVGQASQQFQPVSPYGYPVGVGFEFAFTAKTTGLPADPGSVTIDVAEADTDEAGNYVNITSVAEGTSLVEAGLNASFVGRIDLQPAGYKGKFLCLIMTAATLNSVNVTAKATTRA